MPEPELSSSLRHRFRERRISLMTMDSPLRVATVVTGAAIVVTALLIVLRGIGGAQISLGVVQGTQVTLAAPLFVATIALLCLGFGFLIAGAVFAQRIVAIVGLIGLTVLIGWTTGVLGIGGLTVVLVGWADWASRIVLGLVWVVAVVTVVVRRGRHGDASEDRRMRIVVMFAVSVLLAAYFVILWLGSPVLNGLTLFPQSVTLLMSNVAILATPMLMIAAIDFGEWGEFAADRVAGMRWTLPKDPHRLRPYLVPALLACVAIVYGILQARGALPDRLWQLGEGVILLGIAVAILLLAGRALRVSRLELPRVLGVVALFGVCAVVTWAGGTTVAAASGALAAPPLPPVTARGDYSPTANVQSVTGISGFTALVPVGWTTGHHAADQTDSITNRFPDTTLVVMIGIALDPGTTMAQFTDGISATAVGAAAHDGDWQKLVVRPTSGGHGAVWLRTAGASEQGFYGVATGKSAGAAMRDLEAIVRTVRPVGQNPSTLASVLAANGNAATAAAGSQRNDDLVQVLAAGFELITAVLAGLVLLVFRRRLPAALRLAVLFYGAVATGTLVSASSSIGRLFFGPTATWPVLTLGGLTSGVGLLALVALVVASRSRQPWATRVPRALAALLGAVIVLSLVHQLYGIALSAAEIPQWAAVLILAAVGWDVVMSGEAMTNLSSRTFPRSSRVVAYYGYILVLAAAVLFNTGQLSAATGRRVVDAFFEPEAITQAALFRIGFPLLLLLILLRIVGSSLRLTTQTGRPGGRVALLRKGAEERPGSTEQDGG